MDKLTIKLKKPRALESHEGAPVVDQIEFREATAGDIEVAMRSSNGNTNTLTLAANLNTSGLGIDELRKLSAADYFEINTKLAEFTGLAEEADSGN